MHWTLSLSSSIILYVNYYFKATSTDKINSFLDSLFLTSYFSTTSIHNLYQEQGIQRGRYRSIEEIMPFWRTVFKGLLLSTLKNLSDLSVQRERMLRYLFFLFCVCYQLICDLKIVFYICLASKLSCWSIHPPIVWFKINLFEKNPPQLIFLDIFLRWSLNQRQFENKSSLAIRVDFWSI